ncbi:alpha/beta hydrolase family protein, partial [Angustibacter aerolatus]
RLSAGAVGAAPRLRVTAVVSQAGVNDLAGGSRAGLGGGAVDALLGGGPGAGPERYAVADPTALLPLGVPVLAVHGGDDTLVPVQQSRALDAAARAAGDRSTLVVEPGEDHFAQLDPTSGVWRAVRRWLDALP